MTESPIADFVGKFVLDGDGSAEPARGRILMSEKRIVLAAESGKTTIPLSSVFDVTAGSVPTDLEEFFDHTVTIGFAREDERHVLVIESGAEQVRKFTTVLFKTLLHGLTATVRHPAGRGGRVTDRPAETATLHLEDGTLSFVDTASPFEISLSSVLDFSLASRELNGVRQQVVVVQHVPSDTTVTTFVGPPSERTTNLLGRYLRREYDALTADLEEVSLSDDEVEALVALHAGTEPNTLFDNPSRTTMVLNSLREKDLLLDGADATTLTPKGRIVVSDRIEDANA